MLAKSFQKLFFLLYSKLLVTNNVSVRIKSVSPAKIKVGSTLKFLNYFKIFKVIVFSNLVKLINKLNLQNKLLFYWRFKLCNHFNLSHKYVHSSHFRRIGLVKDEDNSLLKYGWFYLSKTRSVFQFIIDFLSSYNLSKYKKGLRYRTRKYLFRHRKFFVRMTRPIRSFYFYFWRSNFLNRRLSDDEKIIPVKLSYLTIRFFKRKNNLFVNISLPDGSVLFSLTGGRFTTGKKKTSTLTAKHLARILCRLIVRYMEFLQFNRPKDYHYQRFLLAFEFNMLLHTPYIKTFFNIFRQFGLPIVKVVDAIKIPHSFGSKKKKLRRL